MKPVAITQSYAIYLISTLFSVYSFEGYRLDLVDEYFSSVYYTVTITSLTFDIHMTTDNASTQIVSQTVCTTMRSYYFKGIQEYFIVQITAIQLRITRC